MLQISTIGVVQWQTRQNIFMLKGTARTFFYFLMEKFLLEFYDKQRTLLNLDDFRRSSDGNIIVEIQFSRIFMPDRLEFEEGNSIAQDINR